MLAHSPADPLRQRFEHARDVVRLRAGQKQGTSTSVGHQAAQLRRYIVIGYYR